MIPVVPGAHAHLAATEARVVLAELERIVIAAEADAGRSVPNARRPLTDAEFASGVRFGDIDQLVRETAQAMLDAALTITDHLLDALPDMTRGKSQAQVIAMLTRLASPSTGMDVPGIDRVIAQATATAEAALRDAWEAAAQGLLDESASQGATNLPGVVQVDEATDEIIATAAAQVIDTWVGRALGAALQAARSWRDPIAMAALSWFDFVEGIRQSIVGTSTAAALDVGRQAAHQTIAASRGSQGTAEGMPPVREVYASELLDTNTCDPCAAIDGTNFANLEEAWQAYRRQGGYRNCQGDLRCRGVLVIVWDTESAPSVMQPPPPAPPTAPVVPVVPPPAPPANPWEGLPEHDDPMWKRHRGSRSEDTALLRDSAETRFVDVMDQNTWRDLSPEDEPLYEGWNNYVRSGYRGMNGALRGTEPMTSSNADFIRGLETYIDQSPTTREDLLLWRGVKGDPGINVGDVFTEPGFLSTSLDPEQARSFARLDSGIIFRIRAPQGANAVIGMLPEREVLFQRGTRLIITGDTMRDYAGKPLRIIDAIVDVWGTP